jgi:hypothetical protein
MFTKLKRVFTINKKERTLFFQAYRIIGYTSLLISIFPLRRFLHRIGEQGKESNTAISNGTILEVLLVEKAIKRAIKYLPWRSKCFSRAITAKVLLKRMRISSTLYLGVAKDGNSNMIAHAWLRCGDIIVTGKEEMSKFTPIVFFT